VTKENEKTQTLRQKLDLVEKLISTTRDEVRDLKKSLDQSHKEK
jgi:hypothetical protein